MTELLKQIIINVSTYQEGVRLRYGGILGDYPSSSAGVTPIIGEQSTDAAARQAVQEQKHGDEFNPLPHPDTEALVARLNEVDNELSTITAKLYGSPGNYKGPYQGPDWLQREKLHIQCDRLDEERSQIIAQLRQIIDATSTAINI